MNLAMSTRLAKTIEVKSEAKQLWRSTLHDAALCRSREDGSSLFFRLLFSAKIEFIFTSGWLSKKKNYSGREKEAREKKSEQYKCISKWLVY